MVTQTLITLLEDLDLTSNNAVFFFDEKDGKTYEKFSLEIQKKLDIIKPDAFFVFNNHPYILFFDLTNQDNRVEKQIHKQVWSFDYSPLIFIIKYNEIQIFNAFNYDKKKEVLEVINISNNKRKEIFSFWNLENGESWKWLQNEYYGRNIHKKRVNQKLFENIRLVRSILTNKDEENKLSEDEANTLILRLIFIRYLIDRGVKVDQEYVSGDSILERRKSFNSLMQKPRILNKFFEQLNEKFNGVLFKDVNVQLSKDQATNLSWVFSGKSNPNQPDLFDESNFYFEIFDFSIIPVEVISGIYESLISPETKNEQSAIYTPSFLVEYILTETIDKFITQNSIAECKVFDPACGSGIFLVQAYRRMIDKEISILNGDKIKKARLKEIAQNNLYGVDVNKQALMITCFSIYIALLDYQDPKSILINFHFPKLIGENLFDANFLDEKHSYNSIIKNKQIDFILGNPPWKSDKDPIHIEWLKKNNHTTGRYEIAQSFLQRSKDFMQTNTISALIVTSTIFYNISETTKTFKRNFLTQFCLDRFFDLSPVRRLIFEEKDSPAAIVYYRLSENENHLNNVVHHLSIKSNIFLKYFKTLVIEKQDQKKIQQKLFLENDWMFKTALYGGTLDFNFLKKIFDGSSYTLNDHIDNETIFKGDGILKGTPKKDPFNFLTGLPVLENRDIKPFFTQVTEYTHRLKLQDTYLESGRKIELFEGEHIYLKAQTHNESDIVVSYCKETAVNRHDVTAIASSKNIQLLKTIYTKIIADLFTYFQYLTSSAWGVATRPAIRLEEFLSFPSNNLTIDQAKELAILVNSFLKLFKKYYDDIFKSELLPIDTDILFRINAIIEEAYNVKNYEKDLINYVLNVSRYQFQESKQSKFTKKVDNDLPFLSLYANVFFDEFQDLYEDEHLQIEVFSLNSFIAMKFSFQEEKPNDSDKIVFVSHNNEKEILKRIAANLTLSKLTNSSDPTKNLYIQKDIKGFEENSFYIIKPNEYKCWHRAMAWYDVAEIKEAIEQAELNHLKTTEDVP